MRQLYDYSVITSDHFSVQLYFYTDKEGHILKFKIDFDYEKEGLHWLIKVGVYTRS